MGNGRSWHWQTPGRRQTTSGKTLQKERYALALVKKTKKGMFSMRLEPWFMCSRSMSVECLSAQLCVQYVFNVGALNGKMMVGSAGDQTKEILHI